MSVSDETFMRVALTLARRALGRAWPNPGVGAVLVAPGGDPETVARGWTMPGGRPHAERMALERAGTAAQGCTLYVTLEPCAHHGQAPPCTDAIIAAGVKRVVCAIEDPDPRVAGEGLAQLKNAGIEAATGVLEAEARHTVLGHILRITRNRPAVQLKLSVGSDGLVPAGDGAPVWATGEPARDRGHLMRARADAILVGRGTAETDDPALTCRLPGLDERSPVRIVLDSRLSLLLTSKLVSGAQTTPLWVLCGPGADSGKAGKLVAKGAEVVEVQATGDGLNLGDALAKIAEKGVTRLLVEGGPRVAHAFLEAGFVDEAAIFEGATPVGASGLKPFVTEGLARLREAEDYSVVETRRLGADTLTVYRRSE